MPHLTAVRLAQRLSVTRRHATELLASGAIEGRQISSGTWLADSDSVARYETTARRGKGRTLDPATAWGMLWMLSGLEADWLTPSTRSRIRTRLRTASAEDISRAVSERAKAHRYAAANVENAASGLIATSRAAAGRLGVGLMDDTRAAVGYAPAIADEYALTHFMVPSNSGQNIVDDNTLPTGHAAHTMPLAVVAADLATSIDIREHAGGLRALEKLKARVSG